MAIDLLHPNREELLEKWKHVIHDKTFRIFTFTTQSELAWIAENASRASNYLEIGSYAGRSAKVALLANPELRITCLDTWDDEGSLADFKHNLRDEIKAKRVEFIQGNSQDTIKEIDWQIFDACWIDGGHLEHLAKADCENVLPLMKKGSLISGHDYYAQEQNDVYRGVRAALGDVKNPIDTIWARWTE